MFLFWLGIFILKQVVFINAIYLGTKFIMQQVKINVYFVWNKENDRRLDEWRDRFFYE